MGATLRPDGTSENQDEGNQNQGDNSDQGTNNPPSPPPPAPVVKDDPRLSLYEQMAREGAERERQLSTRLQQLEGRINNPEPKIEPLTGADVLNNPERLIERFKQELDKTVAPLIEFRNSFTKETDFDKAKQRLKNDPAFGKHFAKLEPYIDQSRDRMEPTDANMRALAMSLVGSITMGLMPGVSLTDDAPPQNNNNGGQQNNNQNQQQNGGNMNNAPAHLRPSAPNAPAGNNNNNAGNTTVRGILGREMTETEKKMARFYGQSDIEYAQFLVLPSSEVPSTRLGLPEPKK